MPRHYRRRRAPRALTVYDADKPTLDLGAWLLVCASIAIGLVLLFLLWGSLVGSGR